jgi:hypothetical protein
MTKRSLRQLASSIFRSTITATLPSALRPDLSDCSSALMASTVLSMVLPICGTTSPCTADSIARVMPRCRKALALSSEVAGSEKYRSMLTLILLGTALGQDGVDRAFGFDEAGRFSGADAKHRPATAWAYCLRCLNEARLAVSGIEDEVDASTAGQPRDFGSDIVALIVKNVMRQTAEPALSIAACCHC